MTHKLPKYLFFIILFSVIFTGLIVFGTFILTGLVQLANAYGVSVYLGAMVALGIVVAFARTFYVHMAVRRQLRIENLYVLGEASSFYNLYEFQNRVRFMRVRYKKKKKLEYIVAFSFASLSISSNPRHNDEITGFNRAIANVLTNFFYGEGKQKKKLFRYNAFCFHRGEFFLYSFVEDDKQINTLCEELAQMIYNLGQENHIRVMVQPFFGIYQCNPRENINYAIDNAQIARSYGEDSFDTITYFHDSFRTSASSDDITELEKAMANNELVVYYQPKFSLKEKRFISSEALVRWNSPKYGLLSPASFIERAENAGLISQIDLYVFEHALMDIADQRRRGRRVIPVSVNFSLYEFFSPSFLNVITGLLEQYKVPPTLIEVEITETTSQANQFMSISIIKKLKALGVRVLMDDFGIGYSGIDNLRKIPFDAIKIDKSFTDAIVTDEKTRSIVKLLVDLGHMNGIEVIIEGVDNQQQVDIVKKMRLDTIQGFYYSKAIPFDKYEAFLKDNPFEKKGAGQ